MAAQASPWPCSSWIQVLLGLEQSQSQNQSKRISSSGGAKTIGGRHGNMGKRQQGRGGSLRDQMGGKQKGRQVAKARYQGVQALQRGSGRGDRK